jgi:hypothetical protein
LTRSRIGLPGFPDLVAVVCAGIVALAGATLAVARKRRWI